MRGWLKYVVYFSRYLTEMDFYDLFQPCVTMTTELLTPDPHSWLIHAYLHQNWFIRFQNVMFKTLVTNEWINEWRYKWTGAEHHTLPASLAWRRRKSATKQSMSWSAPWCWHSMDDSTGHTEHMLSACLPRRHHSCRSSDTCPALMWSDHVPNTTQL